MKDRDDVEENRLRAEELTEYWRTTFAPLDAVCYAAQGRLDGMIAEALNEAEARGYEAGKIVGREESSAGSQPDIDRWIEVLGIGYRMLLDDETKLFVAQVSFYAFQFEGVYNLMQMWGEETDLAERDATMDEIQKSIDDITSASHDE